MRPSRRSGAIAADEVGARSLPDGSFEFTNVAPGKYDLYAFSSVEVAWRYVTVAGTDVSGVEMQTMPGSHITGRVTFEGPDVPAPQDIGLTPVPANPDFAPFVGVANHAEVHDDWSFEIMNVSGPRRLRILGGPPGWSLKAIHRLLVCSTAYRQSSARQYVVGIGFRIEQPQRCINMHQIDAKPLDLPLVHLDLAGDYRTAVAERIDRDGLLIGKRQGGWPRHRAANAKRHTRQPARAAERPRRQACASGLPR